MQKDIFHDDPLEDADENRAVGVGVVIRFRNAEEQDHAEQ